MSTAAKPFSQPMDPGWRNFTAKMIAKSEATVVPIFFHGHNSRLFQLASPRARQPAPRPADQGIPARIDEPVRIVVGKPLPATELAALRSDPRALMEYLRRATYALSPEPLQVL